MEIHKVKVHIQHIKYQTLVINYKQLMYTTDKFALKTKQLI